MPILILTRTNSLGSGELQAGNHLREYCMRKRYMRKIDPERQFQ